MWVCFELVNARYQNNLLQNIHLFSKNIEFVFSGFKEHFVSFYSYFHYETINVWYKKRQSKLKSSSKTKRLKKTDGYLKNVHPTVFNLQ